MNVYQAIAAIAGEMAKNGISKDRKNQQQGYQFRGIDDVYNALAPMLAAHNLVILPRMISREVVERQTQKGGALFYVTVEAEFDFVSAEDGSKHTVRTFGEAMDSADKATNKAMSAAYKYAAFQTFCIPTEGDNDADGSSHDVASRKNAAGRSESTAADLAIEEQMRSADTVPKLVEIMNGLTKEQKAAANATFNQRMKELKKAA
ncbi:ERF family protein [Burkholderia sp. AU45274]|uniref:ERF family protein n=1 Tax=Burkholderia sp. AU45274 TaxID=3059205 RepID=UPI0026533003|nr:ERF family protein [Burkholderia sp. AU45274]MDN7489463.1 ERF family protein [Burkholderia sp. AU45274]MDN7490530.1 ERF family protein [Burkholderia sp. AU45274]